MQPGPELWPPLVPRLRLSISRANAPGRSEGSEGGRRRRAGKKRYKIERERRHPLAGGRQEVPLLSGFPPPPPLSSSLFHEIDRREKWRGGREREREKGGRDHWREGSREDRAGEAEAPLSRERRGGGGKGGIEKVDRKETSPLSPSLESPVAGAGCIGREGGRTVLLFKRPPNRESEVPVLYMGPDR